MLWLTGHQEYSVHPLSKLEGMDGPQPLLGNTRRGLGQFLIRQVAYVVPRATCRWHKRHMYIIYANFLLLILQRYVEDIKLFL